MATVNGPGMNANVSTKEFLVVVGVGVVLVGGAYWFIKREAKAAADAIAETAKKAAAAAAPVVEKVNPFDQQNILAQAANAVYKTVAGKPATDQTTLATWITDFLWVNDYDPNRD